MRAKLKGAMGGAAGAGAAAPSLGPGMDLLASMLLGGLSLGGGGSRGFSQIPQVTSAMPFDLNRTFNI